MVVTGSMKPIFQDGDAATNLAASVRAAAAKSIDGGLLDQVLICFGGRILRGNRATKIGSGEAAIDTPRVSDLGYFDIDGKFCGMLSWRPGQPRRVVSTGKHVRFLKVENSRVALVRLFPGISSETVKAMLADCSGAVKKHMDLEQDRRNSEPVWRNSQTTECSSWLLPRSYGAGLR